MSGSNWRGVRHEKAPWRDREKDRPKTGVCFVFVNKGSCRFGKNCKFSHEKASSSTHQIFGGRPEASRNGRSGPGRDPEPYDSRLSKFKRLVNEYPSNYIRGGQSDHSVFALGQEILNDGDKADNRQGIVMHLASEEGLSCLRHLAEQRIPRAMLGGTYAKRKLWESEMHPLFRMITNGRVIRSNILEDKVVTIFNFMSGVGCARLGAWFNPVLELSEAADRPPDISYIEMVELSLAIISKMLDCNTANMVNDIFKDYATRFMALAATIDNVAAADLLLKVQADEHASVISRRLKVGEEIAVAETAGAASANHKALSPFPAFRLLRDLPGRLSGEGPRHDNDHDDISKISIFPTSDEIRSTRGEYLPTIDPATWHRSGIVGRLDREFRLLREDTIGQLRDVVRTEIENLQRKQTDGTGGATASGRGRADKPSKDAVRYCTYNDANIVGLDFDRRTGPDFLLRFQQPATVTFSKKKASGSANDVKAAALKGRREWWMVRAKKRLQPGGLVCAIDVQGSAYFFVVADSTVRSVADRDNRRPARKSVNDEGKSEEKYTLADDPTWSYVRLTLAPVKYDSQMKDVLVRLFHDGKVNASARSLSCVLVEFPGILLDSFLHTLHGLQASTQRLDIPFADMIATPHNDEDECSNYLVDIPPPKYTQKPGFAFDMGCLTEDGAVLRHSINNPISSKQVFAHTKLDETQSTALLETLSRSMALIQGPPGTGKTFAGVEILKVLLHNQARAKLGPILIVCYTNHALDQLLEHVLDAKATTKVIRMGSRSKSERLKDLNLREMSSNIARTRIEKRTIWQEGEQLDSITTQLQTLSKTLGQSTSIKGISEFLREEYPHYSTQIYGSVENDSDDGFETVRRDSAKVMLHWLNGTCRHGQTRQPETASQIRRRLKTARNVNLQALHNTERRIMYQMWQSEAFTKTANEISSIYQTFIDRKKAYDDARREADLRCLAQAEIVGVTTTGLARNLELLKNLDSKVLLCEEAGEVLEAHMLTSLLPSLEHAILIGDHQQLRPQVQNYELRSDNRRGAQFSFDTSLFERLVSPSNTGEQWLPFSQLFTQRRMHPSISDLIRAPLYPYLDDGPNVQGYPEVPGISRRLFWLQHEQLEQGASSGDKQADPTSTSRTNLFEIEMTVALVSHLFKQGTYGTGDIAVLTPYLGQMMLLQRRMSSMFEIAFNERDEADLETAAAVEAGRKAVDSPGEENDSPSTGRAAGTATKTTLSNSVRIATVDNFQGEEAKVVVISLVRSNEQQRCGFLSTSNRINVLLSRAQHGMYIIGNSNTCANVPMWQQVIDNLDAGGNIGPSLPLRCPRHPKRTFEASSPDDFAKFAPDGGCLLRCDKRLSCGHSCTKRCHSDVIHSAVKCLEACPRPQKGCDHACPRPCGDVCPPRCNVQLTGQAFRLQCGHYLKSPYCWQSQSLSSVVCHEKVKRTVPGCKHEVVVSCHVNVNGDSFKCTAECGTNRPCGHYCARRCSDCRERKGHVITALNHGACKRICRRPYGTCDHTCAKECHGTEVCPPCVAPCKVRCSHSKCSLPCNIPCVPCAEEKCASHCPHSTCTMPCAAPCNWIPCSLRCTKLLICGHQCPSVCGEQCPSKVFCQVCGAKDALDQVVDFIMMTTYRDTNIDKDPCIFTGCGHILAMSSMDGIMEMSKHYVMEKQPAGDAEHPVSLAALSIPFAMSEAKLCPQCRGSLRNVARYGRIVRRAMLDESTKRFVSWAGQTHHRLAMKLLGISDALEAESAIAVSRRSTAASVAPGVMYKGTGRAPLIKLVLSLTNAARYKALLGARDEINAYAHRAKVEEQPYQRVADLVCFAQRRSAVEAGSGEGESTQGKLEKAASAAPTAPAAPTARPPDFEFEKSVSQVGCHLMATLLLLRCDITALLDVATLFVHASPQDILGLQIGKTRPQLPASGVAAGMREIVKAFRTNRFAPFFDDCTEAIKTARTTKSVRQEVEGHLCIALLCLAVGKLVFWCLMRAENEESKAGAAAGPYTDRDKLKDTALEHVALADDLISQYPSTQLFKAELENVRNMISNEYLSTYRPVTTDELKAVYVAMSGEFRGTGHWYTCANGHPFTVGECGMPMQQVQCPECGAAIGGRDHEPVEGVQRATAMEELGRQLLRLWR